MLILACLGICTAVCFTPFMIVLGTFRTPAITEEDYLQGVVETPATLTELGFKGSVVAARGNTLFLYTAEEEVSFYSSSWRIMDLAGPNKTGTLIVFEIDQSTDEYRFVLINFPSGTTKVVHDGVGDVIWKSVVGEMAMHPTENKVAYFSGNRSRQYPNAYTKLGKLIELDLDTGSKREIVDDVIESQITYSADGDSLFFNQSTVDSEPQLAQKIIKTGDVKLLGPAWGCKLSSDSTSLIVYNRNALPVRQLNLASGKWQSFERSGIYFRPLTNLSESLFLGESLPLTRETARYFPPTGSISGPHLMMRLGVFEPSTQRAAILRIDLDRWEPIASSGQMLSARAFNFNR